MTIRPQRHSIPPEILALSHERDLLRRRGQYDRADILKQQIEDAGYVVKDNPHGAHLIILPSVEVDGKLYRTARQLPSLLDEPNRCLFSFNILIQNNLEQVRRCVESILNFADSINLEIILVDNASQDGSDLWAAALQYQDVRIHVLRTSRVMGIAEARNIGLKQSVGQYVVLLNANIEITGDIFTPLEEAFSNSAVGIAGVRGLHTTDLRHFEESAQAEVEAIDATCMIVRRALLKQVGLFDERYRFLQYMDIDFSFAIRDAGARAIALPQLPLVSHPEHQVSTLPDVERARLTKRNFYRFLEKWGDRDDLLLDESGE